MTSLLVFAIRWAVIIAFLGLVWAAFWQWARAVPTPQPPRRQTDDAATFPVAPATPVPLDEILYRDGPLMSHVEVECEGIAEATRRHEEARRAHPSSQKPDE